MHSWTGRLLLGALAVLALAHTREALAQHHHGRVFLHHRVVPEGAWPHNPHVPYVPIYPHPGMLDAYGYGITSPVGPNPPNATYSYYSYPPFATYNTGIGGSVPTFPYPADYGPGTYYAFPTYGGYYQGGWYAQYVPEGPQ
jgi:hypothetical protein